jgi:competence protein ComEA
MKRLVCLRVLVALLVVSFLSVSLVYAQANSQKLDINKATVSELVTVKGIGEVKAKAIVDFIKKNGAIKDMNELSAVKGIGPKVLETLEQKFEVKPEAK